MARQVVGIDKGNYLFKASTRQVTFIGLESLRIEGIRLITNVMDNIIIYSFGTPGLGGSLANSVLTLNYDTSSMADSDALQIIFDGVTDEDTSSQIKIISDTPGQQSKNLGLPVALVNEHILDMQTQIDSRMTPLVNTVIGGEIDCLQYRQVAIQIMTGAGISAGVLSFEGSNHIDATNSLWAPVSLYDEAALTTAPASTVTLAASTNRYMTGQIKFRYFRIRVSTAVAGGQVSVSSVFRMGPYSPSTYQVAAASNWSTNIAQLAGTGPVTAGVAGTLAVGGNIAPGVLPTLQPLTIGGVDITGLVRRIITDINGQQSVVGPDPKNTGTSNPMYVVPANEKFMSDELLEMILQELKLQSYYLKEMPNQLNIGVNFRETIDDFTSQTVDVITNS